MPDPMKQQDVFFVIEDDEGDETVVTAAMLRRATDLETGEKISDAQFAELAATWLKKSEQII